MVPGIGKASAKIQPFVDFIERMKQKAGDLSVEELIEEILEETGYVRDLEAEKDEESEARIQNINELISKAAAYAEGAETPSLNGFLEEVALVADIDSLDNDTDYVVLMTLHSAKGLEFPNVYLAGMEEGLFPSYMSIMSDEISPNGVNSEIEEERRLAYVGITRAKERLTITSARMRMVRGETQFNAVSRFVKEIPGELLKGAVPEQRQREEEPKMSTFQHAKQAFRAAPTYYGSARPSGRTNSQDEMEANDVFGLQRPAAKKPVYTPVSNQRSFASASTQKAPLNYAVGDRVRHVKFGDGEVTAIVEGGKDYEVTVDFDKVGTKKMFAAFAKLKKI
jgi:DNA helicase-2/ATP-dependent DNA helicase PcrA